MEGEGPERQQSGVHVWDRYSRAVEGVIWKGRVQKDSKAGCMFRIDTVGQ